MAKKEKKDYLSKIEFSKSTRYDNMVKKVLATDDVKALKKMISNRNYRIKKQYEKSDPEAAALNKVLKKPIVRDIRYISQSSWDRIQSIKDPDKLLKVLKSIIIDNTRRRNSPKSVADYSNREADYMGNGLESLKMAVAHWDDSRLKLKVEQAFEGLTLTDIKNLMSRIPSYWAISEGYYYAVTDFEDFMTEIYNLVERGVDKNGKRIKLTAAEKAEMSDKLFKNNPAEFEK